MRGSSARVVGVMRTLEMGLSLEYARAKWSFMIRTQKIWRLTLVSFPRAQGSGKFNIVAG